MEINYMQPSKADTFISIKPREVKVSERKKLFDAKYLIKVKLCCKQLTCTKRVIKIVTVRSHFSD